MLPGIYRNNRSIRLFVWSLLYVEVPKGAPVLDMEKYAISCTCLRDLFVCSHV